MRGRSAGHPAAVGLARHFATHCPEVVRAGDDLGDCGRGLECRVSSAWLGDRSCAMGTDAQRTSGLGIGCSPVRPHPSAPFSERGEAEFYCWVETIRLGPYFPAGG